MSLLRSLQLGPLAIALSGSPTVIAQCSSQWSEEFGYPSPNGRVLSLAHFENNDEEIVVAGGLFQTAGGVSSPYIASWSSIAGWRSISSGINDYVGSLASYQGDLYAGGRFTRAGPAGTRAIAKWNGQEWSSVGGGLFAEGTGSVALVKSMVEFRGELIVAGNFSDAGSIHTYDIARWNGVEWAALTPGHTNGVVNSVVEYNENLIVCGSFTMMGGVPAVGLAQWDGTTFSEFGGGVTGSTPHVFDAIVADGNLYVCGYFTGVGGISANRIARWNGLGWESLGSGLEGGTSPYGQWVCEYAGAVYVSGEFTQAGGVPATNLARWDGQAWNPLPMQPNPTNPLPFVGPMLVHDATLLIGGNYLTIGEPVEKYLASWNGETFSPLGTGNGANGPIAKLASTSYGLIASGLFDRIGDTRVNRLAVFDGSRWGLIGGGLDTGTVGVIVEQMGSLYAGGNYRSIGGVAADGLARWDGATWQAIPIGPASVIRDAVVDGDSILFAGDFGSPWELSGDRVIRWDGVSFSPVGTPADNDIRALHIHGDRLYAGGRFSQIGGAPARRIAVWDGSTWAEVGGGVSTQLGISIVNALASYEGELVVAGFFGQTADMVNPNIARWTMDGWRSVGGGADSLVSSLKIYNGSLYASGSFRQVGGLPISYLARWDGVGWHSTEGTYNAAISTIEFHSGSLFSGGTYTAGPGNSTCISRLEILGPLSDLTGDHRVGVDDLAILLSQFGLDTPTEPSADLDSNGVVNLSDLAILLSEFGQQCL